MTTDDLVGRVAREICCPPHLGQCCPEECSVHYFLPTARAAIAVLRPALRAEALEEAAKVADDEACHCEDTGSAPSDFGNAGRNDAARTIAAAIRALIPKEKA